MTYYPCNVTVLSLDCNFLTTGLELNMDVDVTLEVQCSKLIILTLVVTLLRTLL